MMSSFVHEARFAAATCADETGSMTVSVATLEK